MAAHTTDLLWDISIYVVRASICVVAISVAGIAWVDAHRYLGEDFGNGLILQGEAADTACEKLDETDLKVITHG